MPRKLDYEAEEKRLDAMKEYENALSDIEFICGIDEAGRGPLAGPVVAGACILPKDLYLYYLNDSKKLSESRRETLFKEITENAISFGVGIVDHTVIDDINILQATYKAMRIAVAALDTVPGMLINDAVTIPEIEIPQLPVIHGDAKSVSVAAASILAKVTRDRIMLEYDGLYPGYGFAKNKGYGTSEHINSIKRLGPCPIHRSTFIKKFI